MYKVSVKVKGRWHVFSENMPGCVSHDVERALDKCRIEGYKVELSDNEDNITEDRYALLWTI